jgi:hypothetical protein
VALLIVVETLLKIEFKDEPSAVMPTMAATATRAAIKPYSMAEQSFSRFEDRLAHGTGLSKIIERLRRCNICRCNIYGV